MLVNWRPQRAAERAEAAAEILSLAPRSRQHNAIVWARMARFVDALEEGRAAGVEAELTGLAALERESRRPYVEWCVVLLRSTWATFSGRLAEGARLSQQAVALARAGAEDVDQEYAVQRLALAQQRRRPEQAGRAELSSYAARYADLPVWSALLAAAWDEGRADEAGQAIDAVDRDGFAWLAATPDGLEGCALIAEAVAGLGRRADAERLHELLLPLASRNAVHRPRLGRHGPVRPRGSATSRARSGAPTRRARTSSARPSWRWRWGAPGWELRAIADAVAAGLGSGALAGRGIELAGELELPWVAGQLVEAQKTTP